MLTATVADLSEYVSEFFLEAAGDHLVQSTDYESWKVSIDLIVCDEDWQRPASWTMWVFAPVIQSDSIWVCLYFHASRTAEGALGDNEKSLSLIWISFPFLKTRQLVCPSGRVPVV